MRPKGNTVDMGFGGRDLHFTFNTMLSDLSVPQFPLIHTSYMQTYVYISFPSCGILGSMGKTKATSVATVMPEISVQWDWGNISLNCSEFSAGAPCI